MSGAMDTRNADARNADARNTKAALPERLLLIARSGRILAQSAARAGLRPVVLDLYADQDTRACAEHCMLLAPAPVGFDAEVLLPLAARLAPPERYPLVYGSGLDIAPDLLEEVARGRVLYGNPPELLRRLKTPRRFFALLAELGIPYPEIRTAPPPDPEHWLLKAGCSEGGRGVRPCRADSRAAEHEYFQRRLPGTPMSLLFLADGERMHPIGFNTLWSVERPGLPYLFRGTINHASLTEPQRGEVRAHARRLVRELALKGLHSLDFMLDDGVCRMLELNPRPSATMALYDREVPGGLLAWHIRAFQGRIDAFDPPRFPVRACRAVFTLRPVTIPAGFDWPDWCCDRPETGFSMGPDHPFCTIAAEGTDPAQVESLLDRREDELWRRFDALQPHSGKHFHALSTQP